MISFEFAIFRIGCVIISCIILCSLHELGHLLALLIVKKEAFKSLRFMFLIPTGVRHRKWLSLRHRFGVTITGVFAGAIPLFYLMSLFNDLGFLVISSDLLLLYSVSCFGDFYDIKLVLGSMDEGASWSWSVEEFGKRLTKGFKDDL